LARFAKQMPIGMRLNKRGMSVYTGEIVAKKRS
jgi:hypothetical protein